MNCPTCKTEYQEAPSKCNNCGYPFSASEDEKSKFVAHQILKKSDISSTKDSVRTARGILFFIAAVNILMSFAMYMNYPFLLVISLCIGMIFLFLAFAAKSKPFISIMSGLILLTLLYVLQILYIPEQMFNGIIWKILFLGGLVYSLISIKKAEKIKKESDYLSSMD